MMQNTIKVVLLSVALLLMPGLWMNHTAFSQRLVSDQWQKNIPPDAAMLKDEGKTLIEQSNYGEAIKKLEESLKLKPDYYVAAYNLAVAYARRGSDWEKPSKEDRQRARQEFEKAKKIAEDNNIRDPALSWAIGWLSYMDLIFSPPQAVARRTELYKEAERYLNESLKINPNYSMALNTLGALYELRGDYKRSLGYYLAAAAVNDTKGAENYKRLSSIVEPTLAKQAIPLANQVISAKIIPLVHGEIYPDTLEIDRGDTVIWTVIDQAAVIYFPAGTLEKRGGVPRTRTRIYLTSDGAYTSGIVHPGYTFDASFAWPGTYNYNVLLKEGIKDGKITVRGR